MFKRGLPALPQSYPSQFIRPYFRRGSKYRMTTANFKYIDSTSYHGKPWSKVDGPGSSFKFVDNTRAVHNIRGREHEFSTGKSGFAIYKEPSAEKLFTS